MMQGVLNPTSFWDHVLTSLMGAIPATIFALAALIQAIKTHKSVNSRMDELLVAARSAGRQDERDSQSEEA